jgi:hypothetical protein
MIHPEKSDRDREHQPLTLLVLAELPASAE